SKTFPVSSTAVDPSTGQSYTSQYDVFTVGAGYLDVAAALNNTYLATGSALSPVAVYNPRSGQVALQNTSISGTTAVWGYTAVWGASTVWGSSVWVSGSGAVWGSTAVWGATAVWGSSSTSGFTTVWGATAVWGA